MLSTSQNATINVHIQTLLPGIILISYDLPSEKGVLAQSLHKMTNHHDLLAGAVLFFFGGAFPRCRRLDSISSKSSKQFSQSAQTQQYVPASPPTLRPHPPVQAP
jgi:hypothetical protein